MTHSCTPGTLSSAAMERLLNYKACKSYHCPIGVTLQCKPIHSKSAMWRNCHCASHHDQLFPFYSKTLTTLSSKSASTSAGELLRNAHRVSTSSQEEPTTGSGRWFLAGEGSRKESGGGRGRNRKGTGKRRPRVRGKELPDPEGTQEALKSGSEQTYEW